MNTCHQQYNIYEKRRNRKKYSNFNVNQQSNSETSSSTSNFFNSFADSDSSDPKRLNQSFIDVEEQEPFIDIERTTLGIISNKHRENHEENDNYTMLQRKRKSIIDPNTIIYNAKNKKIESHAKGDVKDLEEFLNKCNSPNSEKDNVAEKNNFIQYINKNNTESNESQNKIKIYEENKYSDNSIYMEKLEKDINVNNYNNIIINHKPKENYDIILNINEALWKDMININQIISNKYLSLKEKDYIRGVISKIKKIDIKDIVKTKLKNGKSEKLELVLDLDNTSIYTYLLNKEAIKNENIKKLFSDEYFNFSSIDYNGNTENILIVIRKGLKEFLEYINLLCDLHINTLGDKIYANIARDILEKHCDCKFISWKSRKGEKDFNKRISDLNIKKENTIIFDDCLRYWVNKENDEKQVILSKFFIDDEYDHLTKREKINDSKVENDMNNSKINKKIKFYQSFCYNAICDSKNKKEMEYKDWKSQKIIEYTKVPFYEIIKRDNDGKYYIDCFTAEYLDSTKYQLDYMKNVIKVIYYFKFIFGIDIGLCIKLLRICTLNNMSFYIKYISESKINIILDLVRTCGGNIITDINNNGNTENKIIYLVTYNDYYKDNKQEIEKDLKNYPNLVLLDVRFIIDSYYFMTDIRDNIYDNEYMIDK